MYFIKFVMICIIRKELFSVEDLLRNKTQEIIILTVWVALRPDFMVSTERVSDVNAGMVLCICVKANETTGHSLQSSILVRCRDLEKFP